MHQESHLISSCMNLLEEGVRLLERLDDELHTIHHFSLMAILLRFEGIEPGEEFGVAPATLRYWQEEAMCAQ